MITYRAERKTDYPEIAELIVQVFKETYNSGEAEAELVEDLRKETDYDPNLSFVALKKNKIIGHALFSKVVIEKEGENYPALVLAPIGVYSEHRKKGIGSVLIKRGIELGKKLETRAIFVTGDPNYYGRHGFGPAKEKGYILPFPKETEPYNMVLEFEKSDVRTGTCFVKFPAPWDRFK